MLSFACLLAFTFKVQWQWFTISDAMIHVVWHITIDFVPVSLLFLGRTWSNIFINFRLRIFLLSKALHKKKKDFFLYSDSTHMCCLRCHSLEVIWWCYNWRISYNSWYRCFLIRSICMGLHISAYMQIDLRHCCAVVILRTLGIWPIKIELHLLRDVRFP